MPELRIILLVIGVLFVAGIAGFEWWRGRGQRPAAVTSRGPTRFEDRDDTSPEPARPRVEERGDLKPLPEIHVVREPHVAVPDELPVIELASTSESGTRRALGISISNEVAVDQPNVGHVDEVSEARVLVDAASDNAPPPALTLSWPTESDRRIVTLRLVPRSEPRFPGRALRQAFSGCGFWHGPLDIYHLPDANGKVVLSAAALAQPGTFDPSIMDSQRFSGLNLFAVLPGPLSERETFDELVHAARQLAERLNGCIMDQHGEELTPERITRLRQSLDGPPTGPVSVEA